MKKIFLFFTLLLTIDYCWTSLNRKSQYKEIIISKQKNISVKHDVFHHHFLPNRSYLRPVGKFGEYKIITNSLGFRDSKIRQIKKRNKKRIIFIGDSFIEGVLLNYEDTVVGLADSYYKKKGIEVLNAGVSSYSPIIYYNKIKYYLNDGLEFSNLVVFIDISDIEDEALYYTQDKERGNVVSTKYFQNLNKNRKNIKDKIIIFLENNFYLSFYSLKYLDDKIFDKFKKNNETNFEYTEKEFINFIVSKKYKRDKWTLNKEVKREYNRGIESSLKNIKLLKNLLDQHDIKLTIAVYPWISQIYHEDLNSLQVKIWRDFALKNNVKFINLFPLFIKNNDISENKYKKIKKYFIPYDVHWNKLGSKIVFDYFIKNFDN